MQNPVRCLACATVYDGTSMGDGLPTPCPRRYLSPHTEGFMALVAEALRDVGAFKPSRALHEAAIRSAREKYKAA
jgi:hypothetical protein